MSARGFVPSRDGWPFSNATLVGVPLRVGPIRLGRVIGGLCGGMCLSALRHWRNGEALPSDPRTARAEIVVAQIRSFDVPRTPYRFLRLQQPSAARARQQATARTLTHTRAQLSAGQPVLLGLVCALSRAPWAATEHHVVLACGARSDGSGTRLRIYDPNHPARDDVTLHVRGADGHLVHSAGRPVQAMVAIDL